MHTNVFTCVKVLPRKESLGLGGGGDGSEERHLPPSLMGSILGPARWKERTDFVCFVLFF